MDTLSSNGFGSMKIAKYAIFSTNCPIPCATRALFLRGPRAKGEQMNKFNFCDHSLH